MFSEKRSRALISRPKGNVILAKGLECNGVILAKGLECNSKWQIANSTLTAASDGYFLPAGRKVSVMAVTYE
jgi:hypothetical protein